MKISITDIPTVMEAPESIMRRQTNLGHLDVIYCELPKGTDFGPLLKGLSNDSCHCPHWGYMIQGIFRITYNNGSDDLLEQGDVFYLPAGHTAIVEADMRCIMFSPEKEHSEVLDHAMKKMEKMNE